MTKNIIKTRKTRPSENFTSMKFEGNKKAVDDFVGNSFYSKSIAKEALEDFGGRRDDGRRIAKVFDDNKQKWNARDGCAFDAYKNGFSTDSTYTDIEAENRIRQIRAGFHKEVEDWEKENRRNYFRSNRRVPVSKGCAAWAITATALLGLAIAYNFYLLQVIGDLVLKING